MSAMSIGLAVGRLKHGSEEMGASCANMRTTSLSRIRVQEVSDFPIRMM